MKSSAVTSSGARVTGNSGSACRDDARWHGRGVDDAWTRAFPCYDFVVLFGIIEYRCARQSGPDRRCKPRPKQPPAVPILDSTLGSGQSKANFASDAAATPEIDLYKHG
jgi:hypothetical protein